MTKVGELFWWQNIVVNNKNDHKKLQICQKNERNDLGQKIFDFELSGTACFKLVFYRNFLTIGGLNSCKVKW